MFRQVVEKVKACGGLPFLTDTNTLYMGSRSNAVEHIGTAIARAGFDYAVAAPGRHRRWPERKKSRKVAIHQRSISMK